jgi:hypothetical protein
MIARTKTYARGAYTMNYSKPLLILATMIALAGQSVASAAATKKDPQFEAFYSKFKTAVVKRDKATIATLTKLPFLYDSKYLDKAKYIARFNEIFPKSTVACFQKEKPIADKDYKEVFCGEAIYIFEKVNGNYLFTDLGVND